MTVVLALGANVGDRLGYLRLGLRVIEAERRVLAASPVYETEPVGGPAQQDYLNAVVVVAGGEPEEVLALAQRAEAAAGRVREVRWGPRTLDVDVIAVDDVRRDDPRLTLPHPRAHERAFVLRPWLDVCPDARLPGHGAVADLLGAVGEAGVRRRDDLALRAP